MAGGALLGRGEGLDLALDAVDLAIVIEGYPRPGSGAIGHLGRGLLRLTLGDLPSLLEPAPSVHVALRVYQSLEVRVPAIQVQPPSATASDLPCLDLESLAGASRSGTPPAGPSAIPSSAKLRENTKRRTRVRPGLRPENVPDRPREIPCGSSSFS